MIADRMTTEYVRRREDDSAARRRMLEGLKMAAYRKPVKHHHTPVKAVNRPIFGMKG